MEENSSGGGVAGEAVAGAEAGLRSGGGGG